MKRRLAWPLFWRIFLLIWIAMAVAVLASNMAIRELTRQERAQLEQRDDLARLARQAAELEVAGERRLARRLLHQAGQRLELHLILLEEDGDTGPGGRSRGRHERYPQRPAVIDTPQGYRLMAWPRGGGTGWLDPRLFRSFELVTLFFVITLACWWIARHISRPLRQVEATAQAIAQGDTALRVSESVADRRDEIGALARAFNAMTARLETLLTRQRQLLRDVSHDLRTPLARQRVAIELASDAGQDAELMATILRQNERLEAMTAQILTLYRVSEKGEAIARHPLSLVEVLEEVLNGARDFAAQRGVAFQPSVSERARDALLLGDRDLLHRALDNVLQNALDHTPSGGQIHIRVALEERRLVCEVRDEGPGVPDEDLAKLFEPFFRSDQARGGQGWGLGLAIAHDILKAHDGSIAATNGDGGGLVVRMAWPLLTA
ncbi:His Kinase A (phospho-acceptor) domain-containing protein [Modicisalibacter ilicicola DSM 19980]|uniref:histidine kinase n=1 Tax=Modicisalibacter ilicicola DSM 19980 TaxID=1121942 RepID=A0A1M5A0I2_9GAMM|nr:HAMP domain-containing sensor histidine kinase [Halomonas ilicicola]SHF23396.1 His Kinase A (phospho-acceptor) domain-containing protein [Halomonas ilicicola DSM 19980]